MLHQGRIIAANSEGGIVQGRLQIFLDVAYTGGILLHAGHDILDMGSVQLQEPGFDNLRREVIAGNADRFPGSANCIKDDLRDLVQLFTIHLRISRKNLLVDILQNDLTVYFSGFHPILSHPYSRGGRGI